MEEAVAKQLEKDLEKLWTNFRVEPTYMQMSLDCLRSLAKKRNDAQPYLIKFLEATKDLPGTAIAVLIPGKVTLLTDKYEHLLEFNNDPEGA